VSGARADSESSVVAGYVVLVACAGSAATVRAIGGSWHAVVERPVAFAAFVLLTLALQAIVVDVYGRGTLSFAGSGVLAVAVVFGAAPAVIIALLTGAVHQARTRAPLHRAVFNGANFALAAGAGGMLYALLAPDGAAPAVRIAASVAAGAAYLVVNVGLLTVAMALSEGLHPLAVWNERFRWFTPYYLASGPLALALATGYERVGAIGMLAFTVPPAMMMLSIRQYVSRTRQSVEDVRRANDELRRANAALEQRNQDLRDLFDFAGGLAAQAHDRDALVRYAEEALERLTGAPARVTTGATDVDDEPLVAGGHRLGGVRVADGERWERVRDAVLPQLATALESSSLVERVRKMHLETIAALSRSMEAKDYYTGGHTERVADVAVALARRLGYEGTDLDAIEIGALLHDIGKIGIPEQILRKPGPLDDDEWGVMKEHPLISEYILAEVDLDPIVCQIARSSHERMDGLGYPDGLAGEEIPLAARIVLVADAFDALTSDRSYRRGRLAHEALEELREHTGTQFCPRVIAALEQLYREEPHVLGGGELRAVSAA
jgi:putative nucleotidyltransferase with HDIG domain